MNVKAKSYRLVQWSAWTMSLGGVGWGGGLGFYFVFRCGGVRVGGLRGVSGCCLGRGSWGFVGIVVLVLGRGGRGGWLVFFFCSGRGASVFFGFFFFFVVYCLWGSHCFFVNQRALPVRLFTCAAAFLSVPFAFWRPSFFRLPRPVKRPRHPCLVPRRPFPKDTWAPTPP